LNEISLSVLFILLGIMLVLSAFFSSSETGMMALNRYRLRHLIKNRHKTAIKVDTLLQRPDRLIGLILLGNNLVNIIAATIATLIGMRLLGDLGVALAPFILVIVFLIFAEVLPKTVAALHPEAVAFPAAYILSLLMKLFYPAVYIINKISNGILNLFNINPEKLTEIALSRDELHTVVREAGHLIPQRHQKMLLSILELENVTVNDIMVPRNELVAIDLNDPVNEIIEQIIHCQHTRLPVYESDIDNIIGILHMRRIPRILTDKEDINPESLKQILVEPYFVPEGTPLHQQLLNFQHQKRRFGLVVDEYGVIQGIVTLEDILEEIVGEFTTDLQNFSQDIHRQDDGCFLIDGSATLRDINRQLNWDLPTQGPKTLNGLILEQLEHIPETGTSMRIGNYTIEITQVSDNAVKKAKIVLNNNNPDGK